jgi:hypothetical protein
MDAREISSEDQQIARQKLRILRQQEIAAALARMGRVEQARQARAKLLVMLDQLDLMEERLSHTS